MAIDPQRLLRVTVASAIAATPSNTVADPHGPALAGLYVIATGNVVFVDPLGNVITLASVPAFTRIPIACSRVNLTGLTATVLLLN